MVTETWELAIVHVLVVYHAAGVIVVDVRLMALQDLLEMFQWQVLVLM